MRSLRSSKTRIAPRYLDAKSNVQSTLDNVPVIGKPIANGMRNTKNWVKNELFGHRDNIFEQMGFTYYGPYDGHNIEQLVQALEAAKRRKGAVLVHVCTKKGKGYEFAEKDPTGFHGISSFDIDTGEPLSSSKGYSYIFGKYLCRLAEKDKRICAITAAMKQGTCLEEFSKKHKDRFFDVGIAEEHAVTFAGGLATDNVIPVFAVYSTFLQRAYDQIIHDAALQGLHVVLAIDRAGIVGEDGETHQGIFDTAFLNTIPNVTVYAPSSFAELENMLDNEGIAERTVSSLRKRIIPNRELVYNMSELSKAGNVEEAYNRLVEVHKNTPLDPALHEDFGWVIFRYLNNKYEEIGSLNSRKALHCYINLENERPSRLHSQMLNLASKISEKYEDFKFLPFLDMWNVCSFSHEDFMSTDWNGKTISPLVDRIIERCFNLRYSLSDVENSFKDNPDAEKRIIDVFSRANFFKISKLYNDDLSQLLKCIDLYIEAIKGKEIKNEYHSKILSILIKKLPENRTVEFIDFLNEWGMLNFQEKDWIREKVDDKEYQSLVEKAISLYINALKIRKYQNVNEQFVILLQEAIDCVKKKKPWIRIVN